jgi:hypothetical protein
VDGNNGALLSGTTFASGEVGQAFSVDASGGGIDFGSPTNLQLQNFTIEVWVKRGSTTKATWDVFDHGQIVAWVWGGFGLGMYDNGHCFLTKVGYDSVISSFAVTDTSFHHLAATKSGSNVVLYLDGVGETTIPFDPGFEFNGTFCIGTRGSDHVTSFRGLIDEASVYNRALSASEIQAIYTAGGAGKCFAPPQTCVPPPTNIVSWWRAEGDGNDAVGENNGTLFPGTTFGSGEVGQAFSFDGDNSAVVVPAAANLAVQSITIEGWIVITDTVLARPIVEFANPTGPCAMNMWYNIKPGVQGNSAGLYGFFVDSGGNYVDLGTAPGVLRSKPVEPCGVDLPS